MMDQEEMRLSKVIERLRAQNAELREARRNLEVQLNAELREATAGIERLRALLWKVLDDTPMYRIDCILEEEIRAALKNK